MITQRPVALCDSCYAELDLEEAVEQAVDSKGVDYRVCAACSAAGVRLDHYRDPNTGRLFVNLTSDRIPSREGGVA